MHVRTRRPATLAALAALLGLAGRDVHAQTLAARLNELFRYGNCAQPLCLTVNEAAHGTHYIGAAVDANARNIGFLSDAIGATLGSIPISATTSGTTFRFVGGAPVATATSAGPIFAERAQTLGRGRALIGLNTTRLSFDRVRGRDLDDLAFNFTHQDVAPAGLGSPGFENDYISVRPSISLTLQSTALFATYGLTDRLDVGIAVPFVAVSLDASSTATLLSTTGNAPTGAHRFGTQESQALGATSVAEGSYFGLGDIALRAKLNIGTGDRVGAALLGDARLPTGDHDNFAGAGGATVRALGVVSARFGRFSPHANAGFAYRGGDARNNAALVTAGFDHLLARSVTLAVDVISELQVGANELTLAAPGQYANGTVLPVANIADRRDDLYNLSAGAKFQLRGVTLVANGLLPLGNGGVQSSTGIYTIGAERTFR